MEPERRASAAGAGRAGLSGQSALRGAGRVPRAGGPGARRSETPGIARLGGWGRLRVPGQEVGDEGASGPSVGPLGGNRPRCTCPLAWSWGPGRAFSPFPSGTRKKRVRRPVSLFREISAAPECYLNSFCLSVPSGVGRNWKLAEMPGAIQPARRGRWGRLPEGPRTGEGLPAAPADGDPAPGPRRNRPGRAVLDLDLGRAFPAGEDGRPGAPVHRLPDPGQWPGSPRSSRAVGTLPAPTGPAGELLYGLKVCASTSQTPACTWPPALAQAQACACP